MSLVKFARCFLVALACVVVISSLVSPDAATAQDDEQVEALLASTAEAMADLESFHFLVTTPVGKTILINEAELESVEGDVVRPLAFRATATVSLGFAALELNIVGIDDQLWFSNPLEGGAFTELSGEFGDEIPPLTFLNPDQLIRQALDLIVSPEIKGTEEVDGIETTVVTGSFDPGTLTFDGTPVIESVTGDLEPLSVTLWIDDQHRVIRADFAGAILPSEQGGGRLVRRIELSDFGQVPAIEAPATTS